MRTLVVVVAAASLLAAAAPARAQNTRRDREDPELILKNRGRTGRCDDLQFTPDGKYLLAVGDDKVVSIWSYADGAIDPTSLRTLRWSIWREQRGAIYTLAVSPNGDRVAVAGFGAAAGNGTVAVLDFATGRVIDAVNATENVGSFWAAAFAPSGKRVAFGGGDGSVWVWDFKALRRLGKPQGANEYSTVRLLHFTDDDHLLSLAENGDFLEWDDSGAHPEVRRIDMDLPVGASVFRAELSPDGKWVAAALQGLNIHHKLVALRSRTGGKAIDIPLGDNDFARALAFDPNHNRLAVAVGSIVPGTNFHIERDDRIVYYDLDKAPPRAVDGPSHSYRADRLVFHPTDARLAVAGGDNHEVTLWDTAQADKPVSVLRGKGSCLWDVALSDDGKSVGFRDLRNPTSDNPNARGRGPWRVFELAKRQWLAPDDFKPVPRLLTTDGWTVEADDTDPNVWYAVNKDLGARHALPRDAKLEGMPRCYTFLEARGDAPVRLAVGHYWGLSVYELTKKEARRTRLCYGHQGEVTALAPSADGSWLVSCSDDMTLAAWSLTKEWPSQPILGASFEEDGAGAVVKTVDPGGPAWEAGLVAKDKIMHFAFDAKRPGDWMPDDPKQWLDRLTHPVPGKEHAFRVSRDGGKPFTLLTTLKQRPLWRFFPEGGQEWVMWMWRNSFYDTSTNGDSVVAWHMNAAELNGTPTVYSVERFKKYLQRPDVINRLLKTRDPAEALSEAGVTTPLHFDDFEPPAVKLEVGKAGSGKDVPVVVSAWARGDNAEAAPVAAELWVNDYRVKVWTDVADWPKGDDGVHHHDAVLPYDKLRAGRNVVVFQTYNEVGVRSDTPPEQVICDRPAHKGQLRGTAVGINDYSAVKPSAGGKKDLGNLQFAVRDAEEMVKAWGRHAPEGGGGVKPLTNGDASRDHILAALEALADADPDALCIVFLSGHGDTREQPAPRPGAAPRRVFLFCCPDYDPANPYKTAVSSDELYEKLAAIPCRKLVLLDACHSGAAGGNPVRALAPGGQGPVILAACDRSQVSWEDPAFDEHGAFTAAILEALGDHFAEADANHDGVLDAKELYDYIAGRVPRMMAAIHLKEYDQVPLLFAPSAAADQFTVARAAK